MKSKWLLRIAALLLTIHLLGHGMGHLSWDQPEDAGMQQAVAAMKLHHAPFMGAVKSMADYYNGYSLIIFGLFGMIIALLWFASGSIDTNRPLVRRLLIPVGIACIYFGIVEWLYFFPFAALMSLLAGIGVLLSLALRSGK